MNKGFNSLMEKIDNVEISILGKKCILGIAIDVQVILQLLVKKAICTREEVAEMREIVKSIKTYRELSDSIAKEEAELAPHKAFVEAMERYLNKQASEKDLEIIGEMLSKFF